MYSILPIEIYNKGQISSHIRNHVEITTSNYEMSAPAGTNVDSIIYSFNDVPKGTIELTITDELKKRLGIDKNKINIVKQLFHF